MLSKIAQTFALKLLKGVRKSKIGRIIGSQKLTPDNISKIWDNLTPEKRDEIRKSFIKQTRLLNDLQKIMEKGLMKRELGRALSTQERSLIDMYEFFVMFEEKVERKKVHSKSGWLIWAEYHPKTKTCFIKMRNGRIIYPFFRVPKSKWLALCVLGGDFMWDKFGRLYSARPQNWQRKGSK